MIPEIDSAVSFLASILRATINGQSLTAEQLLLFQQSLVSAFRHRCDGHWFPERPSRGSAYRCIRIVNRSLDRDLASAATAAGVSETVLRSLLPPELTLWIDPEEVSYRFGEDGSIGVIYDARSVGDSNANVRSSPVQVPSLSAKFSGLRHHVSSSSAGYRISPDTVNEEYLNSYSRMT